jgi:DNA-binding XRE family transcriptional regulator
MNAMLLPLHAIGHTNTAFPAQQAHGDQPSDPFVAVTGHAIAVDCGRILLDAAALKRLRMSRLMSQQDLADDCWRRNIQISIATIKRAESGRAVRFRIARELARCFDVPVSTLVQC